MDVVCRESQCQFLLAALSCPHLPQALFLWGPPGTGKSFVLNKAIEATSIPNRARLSAVEIMCGRRPFFETLLRQLHPKTRRDTNKKCENLRMFIQLLVEACEGATGTWSQDQSLDGDEGRTVIVLDDVEYLCDEHSDILNVFARLKEFTQHNICVIFSSALPPIKFSGIYGMQAIPSIHFPQYSKHEMGSIITTYFAPEGIDSELFNAYLGMVLNVFYQSCRDLTKLLRLTTSNCEYIKSLTKQTDTSHRTEQELILRLWKNIEPKLKSDFKALNSQLLPMTDLDRSNAQGRATSYQTPAGKINNNNHNYKRFEDIPKYTRYILIASYLATHNPPSSDKRFFVVGSTHRTGLRRKLNSAAHSQDDDQPSSRGLRSFDQNRLKSIYAFLVQYCSTASETYEPNVDILMQISSLCHSRFIQNLGEDTSGNHKYRCMADYDFIKDICISVNFELDKHLCRLL